MIDWLTVKRYKDNNSIIY